MRAFLLGTMAFASGQNEGAPEPPFFAPAAGSNAVVSLTGRVEVTNLVHPVLKTDSTDYELLVPRFAAYDAGVKDGQTITVKGYTVDATQAGPWLRYSDGSTNATYFYVTSVTIDGKDYNPWASLSHYGYGPGRAPGYGPGPGMMGWRR